MAELKGITGTTTTSSSNKEETTKTTWQTAKSWWGNILTRMRNFLTRLQAWLGLALPRVNALGTRLGRVMMTILVWGIVLHVAEHFAPELREQLPVLYQIFDGGLEVINFIYLWGMRSLAAIFQGRLLEVGPELNRALGELLQEFISWITAL